MDQLGIPGIPSPPAAGVPPGGVRAICRAERRALILRRVAVNAATFRPDFPEWLDPHFELWEAFEHEANTVWAEGHRHYGARTLWEVMRHHTRHRERSGDWKLNNNRAPDLARLYRLMYPERDGFFETRGRE